MNGQQVPSGSDVTEFSILLDALFAGTWVVNGK